MQQELTYKWWKPRTLVKRKKQEANYLENKKQIAAEIIFPFAFNTRRIIEVVEKIIRKSGLCGSHKSILH